MLPAQPNQSLIDGIACLQAVAMHGQPVGMRELARMLDLEPTRVNRLLKTLAHLGFTRQNAKRKYEPGPGMHVLFAQSLLGSGLLGRARPQIEQLQQRGFAVALGVLWRDQVCYLYHAEAGRAFADGLGRMGLYPASRSSIGQVLLADLPPGEAEAVYAHQDIPGFDAPAELAARLGEVRAGGFARVITTPRPLMATLAVPIGSPAEAGLAVFGNFPDGRTAEIGALLQSAAAAIAAASHTPPESP